MAFIGDSSPRMSGGWVRAFSYLLLVLLLLAAPGNVFAAPQLQDGDIIFHTSKSAQSIAVQHATRSRYSHMGVIFLRNSKPFVFEAVSTVKFTPLEAWISRGVDKHFVVKRFHSSLNASEVSKLEQGIAAFKGRPYDLTFEWSDDRIYCSELVWKLYKRALGIELGQLATLGDFDLTSAEVTKKLRERYGKNVPLEEVVISPDAIYHSNLLKEVSRG